MSGSSSTSDWSPGGGGAPNQNDCVSLTGRGTIMTPDPTILPLLSVGEFVDVDLRSVTGPLQALTLSGQLIGSIFLPGDLPANFIFCINDGKEYQGRITTLDGGLCELLIKLK